MKWLEKIKKSENINQLPTYKELINYTEADWKEYFKNDKFYSRVIKEFNITIEDIKRFKEDVIQHALNKEKSKEVYDELIKLTSKYDSDRYCRFIDEHREEVYDELEYEDRFMLLKNLYIGAKDCTEIGYMLKEEVLDFGDIIPDLEVENIKKVFNGKEKRIKEIILTLTTAKVKELNEILKEKGVKGYSKLKKSDKLEIVVDLLLAENIEVDIVQEEKEIKLNNIETLEEIKLNYDIDREFISNVQMKKSVENFAKLFGRVVKLDDKEVVKESVDKIEADIKYKDKKLSEIKNTIERIKEINAQLETINTDLRIKYEIYLENNELAIESYWVGSSVFYRFDDEYDTYYIKEINITRLDDNYSKRDLEETIKHNKLYKDNVLYILYDESKLEIEFNKKGFIDTSKSILELKMELMNDCEVSSSSIDYLDIEYKSDEAFISYDLSVEDYFILNNIYTNKKITVVAEEMLDQYKKWIKDVKKLFINKKSNFKMIS